MTLQASSIVRRADGTFLHRRCAKTSLRWQGPAPRPCNRPYETAAGPANALPISSIVRLLVCEQERCDGGPPPPTSPLAQHNPTPGNQGGAGRRHEIAGGCRSPTTSPTCGKGNRKIAVPVKLSSMISWAADPRSSAELARSVAAGSIEARRRHSDPATHRSVLDGLSPSVSFLMRGVGPATIIAALAERIGTTPDATGGDR